MCCAKGMENAGIEPATLWVQIIRSANWANPPKLAQISHVWNRHHHIHTPYIAMSHTNTISISLRYPPSRFLFYILPITSIDQLLNMLFKLVVWPIYHHLAIQQRASCTNFCFVLYEHTPPLITSCALFSNFMYIVNVKPNSLLKDGQFNCHALLLNCRYIVILQPRRPLSDAESIHTFWDPSTLPP